MPVTWRERCAGVKASCTLTVVRDKKELTLKASLPEPEGAARKRRGPRAVSGEPA